jgi:hypothetical protein
MKNLAAELSKTGNEWGVAITKSFFSHEDRERLIEVWDLVSIKSAFELDVYFARSMVQIAGVMHPGERIYRDHILYLEAAPNTLHTLDHIYASLVLGKSVISLFAIDEKMETEIREIALVGKRVNDIRQRIKKISSLARTHKKFAKKNMGCASQFDASGCDHMLQTIQVDMAAFASRVNTITSRVRCF